MTRPVVERRDGRTSPIAHRAGNTWLFGLFSVLLAISLILHQLWWNGFEVPSLHFVVIVAALWAIARPTSVGRFAIMLGAEVVAVGRDLPYVGDHTLLVFVTGLCVLAYLGWTLARTRRLPQPAELFDTLAPFLRVQLIIVYAAAALSKLNTGFLDPQTSCAAPMSRAIAWFDPTLLSGTWQVTPAIWATVVVEIALPVLLAIPRTRVVALVLGCGFHVVLAAAGNVPFSALALALYVAFLPTSTVFGLHARIVRHPLLTRALRPRGRALRTTIFAVSVVIWLVAAHTLADEPQRRGDLIADGTRAVIAVMVAVAAALFLWCRGTIRPQTGYAGSTRLLGHPIFVIGVALLLANAASPYLGLKSESTFTMFSNLRTEQGSWNHVLIPESVRVFGSQDRPVSIVATDDPVLADRTRDGTRLTRFELDRYLGSHPGATVTWRTLGDSATSSRGPVGASSDQSIAEKLFHFKDIRPPQHGDCG